MSQDEIWTLTIGSCLEGTGLKMGNRILFLVFYIINYESDNLIYSVLIQTRKKNSQIII